MNTKLISMFAAMAGLAFATPTFAAEKKEKSAKPAAEKPAAPAETKPAAAEEKARAIPFQGKVASVDAAAKIFTTKNKDGKENTFSLTDKTQIVKADGSAGKIGDIKADEVVRGTRTKLGENKWEVVKVTLGAKPAKEGAPAKEGEKPAAKPEEKKK